MFPNDGDRVCVLGEQDCIWVEHSWTPENSKGSGCRSLSDGGSRSVTDVGSDTKWSRLSDAGSMQCSSTGEADLVLTYCSLILKAGFGGVWSSATNTNTIKYKEKHNNGHNKVTCHYSSLRVGIKNIVRKLETQNKITHFIIINFVKINLFFNR